MNSYGCPCVRMAGPRVPAMPGVPPRSGSSAGPALSAPRGWGCTALGPGCRGEGEQASGSTDLRTSTWSAEQFIKKRKPQKTKKHPVLHSDFQKVVRNTQGGRRASSFPQPPFKLAALLRTGGQTGCLSQPGVGLVLLVGLLFWLVVFFFLARNDSTLSARAFFHRESKSECNDAKYRRTL